MNQLFKILLLPLFIGWNTLLVGQTIVGSVRVMQGAINHTWTSVRMDTVKTQCDTTGSFLLSATNAEQDTLKVIPVPLFLSVYVINIPTQDDSLRFDAIPLFRNIRQTVPIAEFTSKRASRRYMRKHRNQLKATREQLIRDIHGQQYVWNGRHYPLRIEVEKEVLTVIIDLKDE